MTTIEAQRHAQEIGAKIKLAVAEVKATHPKISTTLAYHLAEAEHPALFASASFPAGAEPPSATPSATPTTGLPAMKEWMAGILREISTPEHAAKFLSRPRGSLVQADRGKKVQADQPGGRAILCRGVGHPVFGTQARTESMIDAMIAEDEARHGRGED
jgi:hypothetical protein